jgi:hypothetical protein
MIGALARVTVWLMLALSVLGGLFWGLVSTPESNVWMVAVSALTLLALLFTAGLAVDVAMRLWRGRPGRPDGAGGWLRPGLRLVPALVVFAAVWWVAQAAGTQVEASRGRITAAIIARTGWANPEIVFTVARWLVALGAWVIAPLLAFGLFGALTDGVVGVAGGDRLVLAVAGGVASRAAADVGAARLRRRQGCCGCGRLGARARQLHQARRRRSRSRLGVRPLLARP